jgi:hypothetical protein
MQLEKADASPRFGYGLTFVGAGVIIFVLTLISERKRSGG